MQAAQRRRLTHARVHVIAFVSACVVGKGPNTPTEGVFIHEHLVMTSLPACEQIACVNAFRKCLAPD